MTWIVPGKQEYCSAGPEEGRCPQIGPLKGMKQDQKGGRSALVCIPSILIRNAQGPPHLTQKASDRRVKVRGAAGTPRWQKDLRAREENKSGRGCRWSGRGPGSRAVLKTKEDMLRGKAGFTNEGVDLAEIRGNKQHVVAHPGCSLVGRKWGEGSQYKWEERGCSVSWHPGRVLSASLSRPPAPGRSPCLVLHTILILAPDSRTC